MKQYLLIILTLASFAFAGCTKDGVKALYSAGIGKGGSMARFTIQGNYLYTVDKTHLKAYSLTDGANPILKSTTEVGFDIETIFPFGDKLFLGSTSVVHIFSITNPEHPEKLSIAESRQVIRRCDPVVAKDSVAYATLRTNGPCGGLQSILAVYNISNIQEPVEKSGYPLNEPYGLGYADSALYVCDRPSLKVFNITDPYSPVFLKDIDDTNSYIDVIPYNNMLICWVTDGIVLFDITERFDPKLIVKIL
jgi:hypothetical protein